MSTKLLIPVLPFTMVAALSTPARACEGCPTTYGAAGLLTSFSLTPRPSFGVGPEVSFNHWPNNKDPSGYGAYTNFVYYFTDAMYGRLSAGAQGNLTALGGEAGWSYLTPTSGRVELPAATGPLLGGFGAIPLVFVALRATLPVAGTPQISIDLGVKYPFIVQGEGFYGPSGRPLRIDGTACTARPYIVHRGAPRAACIRGLGSTAPAMAERWREDAALEHAAVFAFLSLARSLTALGADRRLIARAEQAAHEELGHVVGCLAMAVAHDGALAALPELPSAEQPNTDVAQLVRETWSDGCVGESLAASIAHTRANAARPERGRALLATIAREEQRHADLGFDVLSFLTALRGDSGAIARAELARTLRHAEAPSFMTRTDEVVTAAEGVRLPRLGPRFDRLVARAQDIARVAASATT